MNNIPALLRKQTKPPVINVIISNGEVIGLCSSNTEMNNQLSQCKVLRNEVAAYA